MLVNCPECNKRISDNAEACPNCGHPINPKGEGCFFTDFKYRLCYSIIWLCYSIFISNGGKSF